MKFIFPLAEHKELLCAHCFFHLLNTFEPLILSTSCLENYVVLLVSKSPLILSILSLVLGA